MNEITQKDIKIDENQKINELKNLSQKETHYLSDLSRANDFLLNRLENLPKRELENQKEGLEKVSFEDELEQSLKDCNPNYKNGIEWKTNCQRCVPTFELRRRGYDVTALPRIAEEDILAYEPFSVWENPDIIVCQDNGKADIENQMAKWGDGARAQITVKWKNTNSGHTFMAEQVDGKTIFYDPQTGKMDVSKYFNNVEMDSVEFCRIDNLNVTNRIKSCYREV